MKTTSSLPPAIGQTGWTPAYRNSRRTFVFVFTATILLSALFVGDLAAQRPSGRRRPDGNSDKTSTKETGASKKSSKKPKGPVTAIVGADIYTVSGGVIRRGVVLIQGDKIIDVGADIKPPQGAKIIDAKGKYITPGFIALSMSRVGLGSTFRSSRSSTSKTADSLDPFDRNIKLALGVGVTSGCVQTSGGTRRFRRRLPAERFLGLEPRELFPAEGEIEEIDDTAPQYCECCGLPILPAEPIRRSRSTTQRQQTYVAIKMTYGDLEPMLLKESPFYATTASSLTGPLNRDKWRRTISQAKEYLAKQEEHKTTNKSGSRSRPPRKPAGVSDEVIKLIKKEIRLRTSANTIDEIHDMVAMAKELDYHLMLDGVAEGWLAVKSLAESRTPVIVTPRQRRNPQRGREDSSGSSIESSGIFEKAGVPFAMGTLSSSISLNGLAGRDLTSLPLEAAFAVRGGASEKAALEALTIVPARLMGLEDRLGSIEKGKDADLLILDGPPLDYRTYVELAVVSGKVRYDRHKDRVYPVFERKGG